jgi:hypothetical protein
VEVIGELGPPLRALGLSDRDIVDANQVASYYTYVNPGCRRSRRRARA